MECKLRIRLSKSKSKAFSKTYDVTEEDYINLVKKYNNQHVLTCTFSASITIFNIDNLKFIDEVENFLQSKSTILISFITIKGIDNKRSMAIPYIILAAREKIKDYNTTLEFVSIVDADDCSKLTINDQMLKEYMKSQLVLIDSADKLKEYKQETKYRLFLDDIMLIERIYPTELNTSDLIEENLFVEIEPGWHHIRVETISGYPVNLIAISANEQVQTVNDYQTYVNIA
jgi:hypothetical protein